MIATAFALLAGAATALSPCVLPVLPVALAAGSTGGRRRPLGVAVGLAGTFALAAVLLTRALDALGLPGDLARGMAIAVLLAFGLALLVPRMGAAVEGRLSRLSRRGAAGGHGDGFRSGLLLGASLGLVYAPCAGPILAAVVALDAAVSAERLALGFAYGIGAAIALLAVMTLGRSLTRRIGPHVGRLQQGFGVLMIAVALLLALGLDRDFQTAIADDLPAVVVNPAGGLEDTAAVERTLTQVRGGDGDGPGAMTRREGGPLLVDAGEAPEFTGIASWLNTPEQQAPSMRGLRGRVVLVDFWTYTCINCLRTFSHLRAWDDRYRAAGLSIVGVHTPEFAFERRESNVRDAIAGNGLRYPVALDNDYGTWNAWSNRYWPAKYLVDARGRVRYWHFGEGDYDETERAIRALLAEAGQAPGDEPAAPVRAEQATPGVTTPETYLGWGRAQGFAESARIQATAQDFGAKRRRLEPDQFAFRGRWKVERERAVAAGTGAAIDAQVGARQVFLVLGSPGRPRRARVLVDGRPLPDRLAGEDVRGGIVEVGAQRLYRLVDFGRVERHVVSVEPEPGVAGYAFTFG